MGEQRNLTEENVAELSKHLSRMQEDNPDLRYRFFEQKMEEYNRVIGPLDIEELADKVDAISRKLDLIFDVLL